MLQVDSVTVEGRTKRQVPGYEDGVEFGVLCSFAYPVEDSGDPHLQVLGASNSSGSEFLLECSPRHVLHITVLKKSCLILLPSVLCMFHFMCFFYLFSML